MKPNATVITFDDWVVVYVGDNLYEQGHSLHRGRWLEIGRITSDTKSYYVSESQQEEYDLWNMPDRLYNFPQELLVEKS